MCVLMGSVPQWVVICSVVLWHVTCVFWFLMHRLEVFFIVYVSFCLFVNVIILANINVHVFIITFTFNTLYYTNLFHFPPLSLSLPPLSLSSSLPVLVYWTLVKSHPV